MTRSYFLLILCLLLTGPGHAQTNEISASLNGEWIATSNVWSYDGPGSGVTSYTKDFFTLKIIKFDTSKQSLSIREGNELLEDIPYRIVFDTIHDRTRKLVWLLTNKVYVDGIYFGKYFEWLDVNNLVSEGYAPGNCTNWDTFRKIGSGFIGMKVNGKNKRLVRKLLRAGEQVWDHDAPLNKEEGLRRIGEQ